MEKSEETGKTGVSAEEKRKQVARVVFKDVHVDDFKSVGGLLNCFKKIGVGICNAATSPDLNKMPTPKQSVESFRSDNRVKTLAQAWDIQRPQETVTDPTTLYHVSYTGDTRTVYRYNQRFDCSIDAKKANLLPSTVSCGLNINETAYARNPYERELGDAIITSCLSPNLATAYSAIPLFRDVAGGRVFGGTNVFLEREINQGRMGLSYGRHMMMPDIVQPMINASGSNELWDMRQRILETTVSPSALSAYYKDEDNNIECTLYGSEKGLVGFGYSRSFDSEKGRVDSVVIYDPDNGGARVDVGVSYEVKDGYRLNAYGSFFGQEQAVCVDAQVNLSENKAGVDSVNVYAYATKDKQGETEARVGMETLFKSGVSVGAEASNKGDVTVYGGVSHRF